MKMKMIGLGAAMMLAPLAVEASTVTGTYDVTAAVSDRSGAVHSLWFDRMLATTLHNVFVMSSPGIFVADAVGATMTGSVENRNDATAGFDFSFTYDRDFSDNADTTPEFKAVWADVMEHGNEDYFDFEGGIVTGTGSLAGLNFEFVRAPASGEFVTQVGGGITAEIGANQHNSLFGASGWMEISAVSVDLRTCTACDRDLAFYEGLLGRQTDINVTLTPAAVPVPAAGVLLLSALVGAGAMRRRRKS